MFRWQSLCLAFLASLTSASTAFPQANAAEIQSGDVWLLTSDQAYPLPVIVLPQTSASNGELPTGDVWIVPGNQTVSSVTAEKFRPADATLANRNE